MPYAIVPVGMEAIADDSVALASGAATTLRVTATAMHPAIKMRFIIDYNPLHGLSGQTDKQHIRLLLFE